MAAAEWSNLTEVGWAFVALFFIAAVAPIVHAWRAKTSVALAMSISLIFAWIIQYISELMTGEIWLSRLLALQPSSFLELDQILRLVAPGWLHSGLLHLLGNLVVIILVGVPLEQRLGRERWLAIFFIGLLGGNLGWVFSHWGDHGLALGASGAAFGLLGCYLACWPSDEIEFPFVLIRKWPISLIALLKLGIEILQYGLLTSGAVLTSNVAHLAHITGFFACYVLAKPIAKGGPVEIGVVDSGPSAGGAAGAAREAIKKRMGSLASDPWSAIGKPLDGEAGRTLQRLREEGDELETRQAWLEQLSEIAKCPECDGVLIAEEKNEVTRLRCIIDKSHLEWP